MHFLTSPCPCGSAVPGRRHSCPGLSRTGQALQILVVQLTSPCSSSLWFFLTTFFLAHLPSTPFLQQLRMVLTSCVPLEGEKWWEPSAICCKPTTDSPGHRGADDRAQSPAAPSGFILPNMWALKIRWMLSPL